MRNLRFISALCTVLLSLPAAAEEPPAVEDLVARVRASIVTIRHAGRGQRDGGLGTGFVVAADGLIATNLHVIGEARPITVELADGTTHEATAVHASDRTADLAVVRIDARDLTPLPLGPANGLADGQEVVAVGNPHGLERSVVTGRLSARRQIDGIDMLQLAIPIESGNSGGPLMDRAGQVHGILTMKSLVTPNLGFAVEAKRLRSLLDEPNPVVIERWLTIGALDPDEWTVVGGARWRQRAGALAASGSGQGFGGRSLCLATKPVPERPYEVAVRVKLADESGAAGLAFAADGGDRHYGFYPSAGKLRLTRFDGPDVFSWQVLAEVATAAYRPGDWNHLRVRVTTEGITCFVNDEQVILSADGGAAGGRTGLATFRGTDAEFRGFITGRQVPPLRPPADVLRRMTALVEQLPNGPLPAAAASQFVAEDSAAAALSLEAAALDRRAGQLRELAAEVRHRQTLDRLALAIEADAIDLFSAALLIAELDNPELDRPAYERQLERLARDIAAGIPDDGSGSEKLAVLDRVLFEERGFHGSRGDYYNRANSYVNEVLDDREGIPITLAVIYMELASRLGVAVEGIGFPGHFLVRHDAVDGPEWIDVFDRGRRLSRTDLARRLADDSGETLDDSHLEPAPPRAILARMLNNLLGIASRAEEPERMLRYLDALILVDPDSARNHVFRMVTAHRLGRSDTALTEAHWLLDRQPEGVDLGPVRRLAEALQENR